MKTDFLRTAVMAAALVQLVLGGCGNNAPPVDLDRVQTLVDVHQYARAEQQLAAFEARTGGSPRSHRMMVDVWLGLGNGFAAEVYLKKLGPGDIADSERKTLLAHSMIVRDRPFDAITILNEQIARRDWSSETYRIAIWAHRAYERDEAAAAVLEEGLAAFPRDSQLLALKARNLLDDEDVGAADGYAAQALQADGNNFEARLISAEIALRQGRLDDALAHYRAAHRAFPNDPLPTVNIAGILIDQNKIAEARPVVAKGLAEHRGFPLLMFQQARIEVLSRDYLAAQRSLNSAWSSLESYVPAQILSARVSVALGNRDTADAMLTRAASDPRFAGEVADLRAKFSLPEGGAE